MTRSSRGREADRCAKCIYGVIGYSKIYHGLVVGCNADHLSFTRKWGTNCFVPKNPKHESKNQDKGD